MAFVDLLPDETGAFPQDAGVTELGGVADVDGRVFKLTGASSVLVVRHGLDRVPSGIIPILVEGAFCNIKINSSSNETFQVERSDVSADVTLLVY